MGLILIGLMIAIVISIVGILTKKVNIAKISTISILVIIGCVLVSIIQPTGYSDWYITEETELKPLYYNGENPKYVKYEDGQYLYRFEVNEITWTETSKGYDEKKISISSVNIVEDPNCTVPECVEYSSKPIETVWTLGVIGKINKKYVLYVPKGSIEY